MASSKNSPAPMSAALPPAPFAAPGAFEAGRTAGSPAAASLRRTLVPLYLLAVGLSLIAVSISGYLTYIALTASKVLGCSGGTFDCDHVLQSQWSTLLGIPVAALASSLYVSVLAALLATGRWATSAEPTPLRSWTWTIVTTAAVSAGAAGLWFTGLQVFALGHLCPWCLATHACGLILCCATLLFSPLSNLVKGWCGVVGLAMTMGLATIQSLTPPRPAYVIEEAPAAASTSSSTDSAVPAAELFDAPGEGDDIFAAPEIDSGAYAPQNGAQQWTQALAWLPAAWSLWKQPSGWLMAQTVGDAKPAEGVVDAPSSDQRLVHLASANIKLRANQWPIVGSPDAKHIFVELFDYTCPHCRATQKAIAGVRQRYGNDVAILTLPVPLSRACNDTVKHEHASHRESCELAKYAIAVWRIAPEKFPEFHDWLLTHNPVPTASAAKARAAELVGAGELDKELAQPHAARFISKHVDIYRRLNAGPVPKLVFASTTLTGEVTSSDVIAQILER